MIQLEASQQASARPLFSPLTDIHLSLAATLAGTAPGRVWVDDPSQPSVAYAISPEGHYLVGDPKDATHYADLKATVEHGAYLLFHPLSWTAHLSDVWSNQVAYPQARLNLRFKERRLAQWRVLIPPDYTFVQVDEAFLQRTSLKNHSGVLNWIKGWHSSEDFLENALGFCILHGETIASMSMMDCRYQNTCEIGIRTDENYRRQGLAALVTAGMVDACLERGIDTIGWHCFAGNLGSRSTAEKVGFDLVAEYVAYSPYFPSANPGDLSAAEWAKLGAHYEQACAKEPSYRLDSAAAWALAGDVDKALAQLRQLQTEENDLTGTWLESTWVFATLRDLTEFKVLIASWQGKQDQM